MNSCPLLALIIIELLCILGLMLLLWIPHVCLGPKKRIMRHIFLVFLNLVALLFSALCQGHMVVPALKSARAPERFV